MSHRSLPSGFVKSILHNGVGRYVCQLQRVTLKFCKSHGDSRGIRDFIENHLLEFVNKHPGVVVYLQPRRHHSPLLYAEYLNGKTVHLQVGNYSALEVCQWMEHLRCRSGEEIIRLRKTWHTDSPSIQGIWTPFTNMDPSVAVTPLPSEKLSAYPAPISATDHVKKLSEQIQELKLGAVSANLANTKQQKQ